jgi:hypothetical protein
MRATRSTVQILGFALAAAVALAGATGSPAIAAPLPTDNLVRNGDEGPLVSPTGNDVVTTIVSWGRAPTSRTTVVRYGAPGFPTTAQAAMMGAGQMFFAGGPSAAGDNNSSAFSEAEIAQTFLLPADAAPYVAAGGAQITISACLGGYADQDDYVSIDGGAHGLGDDRLPSDVSMAGPSATERHDETQLLPRSVTATLPPGASIYTVVVHFHRASGAFTYNDGYADKIEAHLSAVGSAPPEANCTAPQPPGSPVDTSSGAPKVPDTAASVAGSNTAVPLTRAAKRIVLTKHYALLKLHCAARDEACRGTVTLRTKTTKLGSATFKIAIGKTATIKVKLGRRARGRLARLSRRQLAKLKITATATIGTQKTTFTLGAKK